MKRNIEEKILDSTLKFRSSMITVLFLLAALATVSGTFLLHRGFLSILLHYGYAKIVASNVALSLSIGIGLLFSSLMVLCYFLSYLINNEIGDSNNKIIKAIEKIKP